MARFQRRERNNVIQENHMHIKAKAKINLALDVVGKRDDGYHELRMIMQEIELYDLLNIRRIRRPIIQLRSNQPWLPVDERNLVCRAVKTVMEKYSLPGGVQIYLHKVIPVGAGLAGGSSDCAAALKAMNKLFNLSLSSRELLEIGASLGSDVPFCLVGGTALAEGRGELLTKLPPHPSVYVLLAKPAFSVSTASVFKGFDMNMVHERPDIDGMIRALEEKNLKGITDRLYNALEQVTERKRPIISDIKEIMLKNGALGVLMTGSGPTVYGYFTDRKIASQTLNQLKKSFPKIRDIFLTRITGVDTFEGKNTENP